MSKYIFVVGGVCSSLGKGVATSSIGALLKGAGLSVAMMKCDPYINIDAGNMSPYQNGEIYVTDDGVEADLDFGNYARFTGVELSQINSVSTGKVYEEVIKNERAGRYNGRTVQVIPHITDEIKRRILNVGATTKADVVIVEIGGTVGDFECIPFLEASRQLIRELGKSNALSIFLTLVPILPGGEMKTKPTQHSVKEMQQIGIQPDILLCRCETMLDADLRKKIALFCNVSVNAVFSSTDVESSIYELPVLFHEQGIGAKILSHFGFSDCKTDISEWTDFLNKLFHPKGDVCIALLGKKDAPDSCYKSVRESLFHAAVSAANVKLTLRKIDAEDLEASSNVASFFKGVDGTIIPGSFGQRGFLGMLSAVKFARENAIPFFGIDLGMQLMAIETARNLLNHSDADSTEFMRNSTYPVISLPEEQSSLSSAGVMRLGSGNITLAPSSKLEQIYGQQQISERHRSKYAFDRKYTGDMKSQNLDVTAYAVIDGQAESFEWQNHPWGIGVQFHPEFTSRPAKPHPLFVSFIEAALKSRNKQ